MRWQGPAGGLGEACRSPVEPLPPLPATHIASETWISCILQDTKEYLNQRGT